MLSSYYNDVHFSWNFATVDLFCPVWIGLKLASKVNVSSSIYTQNKSKRVFRKKKRFESQSGVRF